MKLQFDKRHQGHRVDIALNDLVLVRKRLRGSDTGTLGPFKVVPTPVQQAELRTIEYLNNGQIEFAGKINVLRYHPRRDEQD